MIMSDITKVQDDVSKIENDVSILKKSSVSSSSGGGVSSGTNANLIADGSVSNTEFQYLSGVTSAIQSQLDGKLGLTAGTTTDHQKLVMYNNAGGGADPSFAFAAIKDTTTSIDSNRTFRVNSGSHTNNRDFTVNTVGEVEAASFTASSQVSITGTGAGGDDVGNTPAAVALRCLGGMTIGPAGALSATPEKICLNGVIGLGSTATGVSYGTQGQVLTSQGSAALPTWTTVSSGGGSTGQKAHGCATFTSFADKIYIEEEGSSSLNNGLLLYNASNTNYSHNGTTVTVHGHSNYPCIGPSWTTTSPTVLDDHTTTLYGMTERYTSVGVTLINSAMNNGAPTQWRGNDRLDSHAQGNTNTPPTRWRILTTGEYHVKATIAIGDSTPNGGNWTQAWIFVRTGQLNPNDGSYENTTTVRVAAYQKLLPAGGGSGLDERVLQFDEALRLNQHDEVYIGMSHGFSTGTEPNDNYYMGNVQTTFSIGRV